LIALFVVTVAHEAIAVVDYRRVLRTLNDRTTELAAANRQLELHAKQAKDLAIAHERNSIAREIHDSLSHYFTGTNAQLMAGQKLLAADPARAVVAFQNAQRLTKEGLDAVRNSITTLREMPVGNKPLPDALQPLLEISREVGIQTTLTVQGTPRSLVFEAELALYRTVQEGLTNVRKHAHARQVEITLDYRAEVNVRLEIQDDGRGSANAQGGFGLLGVRERAAALAGTVAIHTQHGRGFTLTVELPNDPD
jgi:signal transduction histidine kinase